MKKICLILSMLFLLISCEDLEQTVDYTLPYKEKLVIQGELSINSKNLSVRVTKSIPPLEELTPEKVQVSDAICKVYYEDKVIDLDYVGESMYVSDNTISLKIGVEYRLEVKWKEKIAIAKTTIPRLPEILAIEKKTFEKYDTEYNYLELIVQSKDKGMASVSESDLYYSYNDLVLFNEQNKEYNIIFGRYYYDPEYQFSTFNIRFYDIQYYSYFVTRREGDADGGFFNSSGLNVEGNVEGKDAIGLWIGYNSKTDSLKKYLIE